MKLNKVNLNKLFGTDISYHQLPLIYQLATKKDMNEFPVIKVANCNFYVSEKMPVYSFYKPIINYRIKS